LVQVYVGEVSVIEITRKMQREEAYNSYNRDLWCRQYRNQSPDGGLPCEGISGDAIGKTIHFTGLRPIPTLDKQDGTLWVGGEIF
jgi:hypothetical protein